MLRDIILAGCGGFVGAAGRLLVCRWTAGIWHGAFPLGTFLVNVSGCFIIGLLFGLLEHAKVLTPTQNLLLVTGFCGGFTTFSTFANDMWQLSTKGDWLVLALYLFLSIAIGILCVWAGRSIIRCAF